MGIAYAQHKNIVMYLEESLKQLKLHEHDIAICSQVDTFWYLQKIEEITLLQEQVQEVFERYRTLRLRLHEQSHQAYLRTKADKRIIKRCSRGKESAVQS